MEAFAGEGNFTKGMMESGLVGVKMDASRLNKQNLFGVKEPHERRKRETERERERERKREREKERKREREKERKRERERERGRGIYI